MADTIACKLVSTIGVTTADLVLNSERTLLSSFFSIFVSWSLYLGYLLLCLDKYPCLFLSNDKVFGWIIHLCLCPSFCWVMFCVSSLLYVGRWSNGTPYVLQTWLLWGQVTSCIFETNLLLQSYQYWGTSGSRLDVCKCLTLTVTESFIGNNYALWENIWCSLLAGCLPSKISEPSCGGCSLDYGSGRKNMPKVKTCVQDLQDVFLAKYQSPSGGCDLDYGSGRKNISNVTPSCRRRWLKRDFDKAM